jgi:hypothetical protein
MHILLEILGDLMQLNNPWKTQDLVSFAMSLARWVFLLILSLVLTAVVLHVAGQ